MSESGNSIAPEHKWEGSLSPLTFFRGKLESGAVLAIGEAHWYVGLFEQMTQVLLSPELDGVFSYLFVEFGNAKHQALLNDYLRGKAISEDELAAVWLDSIAFPAWLHPCYGEFFRRLKEANRSRKTPLEVILTEPAFNWQDIDNPAQLARLNVGRDQAFLDGIRRVKKATGQGVVVLVGARHIIKCSPVSGPALHQPFGVLAGQMFVEQYVSVWPHMLPTELDPDNATYGVYSTQQPAFSQMSFVDLVPNRLPVNPYPDISVAQLIDAYWYLGPQCRKLDAAGIDIPQVWKARLKQRLPLVNERQSTVIQKVIE
ncbi:hypothetical protein ACOMICROBIO_FLGHMIGD_00870 [Vibrio sp. B1FLJ16]|uniref:hypothetical protein n=1 Tax=Vibrio sp. B1FLJ16 TaxID=2751178 RepID=UPI0015F5761B|nr:hypothetical protein [Vibrio sp. B1FLJ16]CAD7801898.1 hypothetical protein ACOMICROBIO_FLGHMIGD_00870 [Vibrio sp. B1FLJ16]CAE6891253.1 hypothetical protein ACOMICROBIO_FLGHMIGD_00870 [Vibrio sp. B1FLJ16]